MIQSSNATFIPSNGDSTGANQVVLQDRKGGRWLSFRNPCDVITTREIAEVPEKLVAIDRLVTEKGHYAAGFIAYEASPAFDDALVVRSSTDIPLLWFGIYNDPEVIAAPATSASYNLGSWQPSVTKKQYDRAFYRIKELIAAGRTYQVNYTLRLRASFSGSAWALFQDLVRAQESDYSAYLDLGPAVICSASPELFFELDGTKLTAKPMKGTAPRGRTLAEDNELVDWLYHSEKNRAENVMIVDMIRNDIGRVSNTGSVKVPQLFEIERYPTILQMTSTVTGRTDAGLSEIMTALFPCASITGAPKVSTMKNIADLETDQRGIYTGTIGFFAPGRQAQFNVAIRTVFIDKQRRLAEYGVGGGIVWGSDVEGEYEECQTKARILTERRPIFELLESILWTPEIGFFLLQEHLKRLSESAQYFQYHYDELQVRRELIRLGDSLKGDPHKVRLLLHRDGKVHVEALPMPNIFPVDLVLAAEPIESTDVFLYHKTTRRLVYERACELRPGYDDVLLWNKREEITETSTSNVVIRFQDELITPPISCGLLAGTFRADLLANEIIHEGIVTVDDLANSDEIFLINSVRKWRTARLVSHEILTPDS